MMPWQVLSVEDSVSTVRFIDYGNTEQKTLEEMFRSRINHFAIYNDNPKFIST